LSPRLIECGPTSLREPNRYSVPVHLVGRQIRVHLHASHLIVYDRLPLCHAR
jgi:hypothetical protein